MNHSAPRIAYYVSGHGYGHAVRSASIIQELRRLSPGTVIHVVSQAPLRLFTAPGSNTIIHHARAHDVGVIEAGMIDQDVAATYEAYRRFEKQRRSMLDAEVEFLSQERIDLVLGDIPPLAITAGSVAGLPTMAIGNFAWDFIYKPYKVIEEGFTRIISDIEEAYGRTDLLYRLPLHEEMSAFPRQIDVPLVARKSTMQAADVRKHLGLAADDRRRIILLAFRLPDLVAVETLRKIVATGDYIVLAFDALPLHEPGTTFDVSTRWSAHAFPDIVSVSDLIIAKLGYGIIADCAEQRKPLMYPPRRDFAEYEVLTAGIGEFIPSYLIPEDDFVEGRWLDHIQMFLDSDTEHGVYRSDGAEVIASDVLRRWRNGDSLDCEVTEL